MFSLPQWEGSLSDISALRYLLRETSLKVTTLYQAVKSFQSGLKFTPQTRKSFDLQKCYFLFLDRRITPNSERMELSYGLSYKSLCIVIEELDSFFFFFYLRSYLYLK